MSTHSTTRIDFKKCNLVAYKKNSKHLSVKHLH